jgi:hypothetical protein
MFVASHTSMAGPDRPDIPVVPALRGPETRKAQVTVIVAVITGWISQ